MNYRKCIRVDTECKSWLDIENDNFSNCSTSSFYCSEHINSRRTSPVPFNIDSLFHVRMTNSCFCAPSLSCVFGIMMQWKHAISPQFILVLPTKLHLWVMTTSNSYTCRICEFQLQFSNRISEVAHETSTVPWPGHSASARLRPMVIGDMLQFKTVSPIAIRMYGVY